MNRKLIGSFILFNLLLILVVAYAAVGYYFSSQIVAFSVRSLEEDQQRNNALPAQFGLPEPEEVLIDSGDVTLAGWLFTNEQNGDCGVILLHGRSATRYQSLHFTPLFWPRGCDLLLLDVRYHGASSGDYGTYGYYEKEDTLAALHWLAARRQLATEQIGLMGVSYGGATVLQTAALESEIAFVAADSAYSSMETIIREQAIHQFGRPVLVFMPAAMGWSGRRADFDPGAVAPAAAARQIGAPVFLTHSLQDAYTAADHSQRIYDNVPHGRKVLRLTDWGTPHGRAISDRFDDYKLLMDDFLQQHVPQFGQAPGR
jgi:uncharacterized protein